MKFIFNKMTVFILCVAAACSNNAQDELTTLENQPMSVDDFFTKVSSMQLSTSSEDNVIYITYEWDSQNKTMEYISSEEGESELDYFVLKSEKTIRALAMYDSYTVTCEKDGDETWSEDCGGKYSCGKLIAKCLEEDGCAEICKKELAYAPSAREFHL